MPIPRNGDGMCPLPSRLYRLYGNQVVVYVENAAKAIGRSVLLDDESIKQKRVLTLFNNWGWPPA